MPTQILTLPDQGDFSDIPIIEILINEGDTIDVDDPLLVLESDKATMEVPTPVAGTVTKVIAKVGQKLNSGDPMIEIATLEDKAQTKQQTTPAAEAQPEDSQQPVAKNQTKQTTSETQATPVNQQTTQPSSPAAVVDNQQAYGASFHASPKIRQYANRLGVALQQLSGSGPNGRITEADVDNWVKRQLQTPSQGISNQGIPEAPLIDFSEFGETESIELSRIQKISGSHLTKSWLNAPQVTQFNEADIQDLENFRQKTNQHNQRLGKTKITPLAILVKAVAQTLKEFPRFNASLAADKQQLILKKYLHIGFAVDTPHGLVVPVIRDVDQKGIQAIADELAKLAEKARDGNLSKADMSGGCFTISSLGSIGGTHFTPIINLPEVAILGVGKASIKPIWDNQQFQPRLYLPLALSYDHRIIDGAEGARFSVALCNKLSDLASLAL